MTYFPTISEMMISDIEGLVNELITKLLVFNTTETMRIGQERYEMSSFVVSYNGQYLTRNLSKMWCLSRFRIFTMVFLTLPERTLTVPRTGNRTRTGNVLRYRSTNENAQREYAAYEHIQWYL
jgi:hypothetical protein